MKKPVFIVTTHASRPRFVIADTISIKSAFTGSSYDISKGRLKYLVEHDKIELANARFQNDKFIVTKPYKTFKTNIESQIDALLKCEIDNFDVLSESQKEISKRFPSAFELDVKQTSTSDDEVYSKPVRTKNGYTIHIVVDVTLTSLYTPIMFVDVYISNNIMNEHKIKMFSSLEDLEKLLNMISNLPDDITFDEQWDDIIISFLSQPNWYNFKVLDFEKLQNICNMFNITDEFFEYLRNRIKITAEYTELINQCINIFETQYNYHMTFDESTVFLALHTDPSFVARNTGVLEDKINNAHYMQHKDVKFDWEPLICALNI